MTRYSAHGFPHYVLDYVSSSYRTRKDVVLERTGRDTWRIKGDKTSVSVTARTVGHAREKIRLAVCDLDPRTDRRRSCWYYT